MEYIPFIHIKENKISTVRKLSGSIGAEIIGMHLENDLSDAMLKNIRELLNEHEVIFFRDQDISWKTHCPPKGGDTMWASICQSFIHY